MLRLAAASAMWWAEQQALGVASGGASERALVLLAPLRRASACSIATSAPTTPDVVLAPARGGGEVSTSSPWTAAAAVRRPALSWRAFASPSAAHRTPSSGAASGDAAPPADPNGIVLDDSAVQRLLQLQQAAGPGEVVLLRVEVEGGGCSGFQYKFKLDSKAGPDDRVFERGGARLVTDAVSLGFLRGAVVEFEDSLMRSAFQVAANPNSESTCGCGSSFVAKA